MLSSTERRTAAAELCDLRHDLRPSTRSAQITARSRRVYMGPATDLVVRLALLPRELPVQPWTAVSCPPTKARCMSALDLDRPSDGSPQRRRGAGAAPAQDGGTRLRRPTPGKPTTVVPATRPGEARHPRPRPTPRPAAPVVEPVTGGVETADLVFLGPPVSLVQRGSLIKRAPVDAVPARPHGGRHRRTVPVWRRPAFYLAAALVAGLGTGVTLLGPSAQADPADAPSHSMSVAQELGISAQGEAPVADAADTARLQQVAATRATREAEQATAARMQQD